MTVNTFLESWNPTAAYLNVDALKTRFAAIRGLSNVRPDLTLDELVEYADNVLVTNQKQYEALTAIDPYKTYFEESNGDSSDTESGSDTDTETDTRVHEKTSTPGVTETNETTYGKTDDSTYTPTGIRQTDNFTFAYNATTANQPTDRMQESFVSNYKETNANKSGGKDSNVVKRTGSDTDVEKVTEGNLVNKTDYGHKNENEHHDKKSGYVLRDVMELTPLWVNIYDRIVSDVFQVIGSLISTRKVDLSLEW